MKIMYEYKNCGISEVELNDIKERVNTHARTMRESLPKSYETLYASLGTPEDTKNLDVIEQCIEAKQKLKPTSLWIIGIGGSNMGTLALYHALEHANDLPCHWVDTIDSFTTRDLLIACEKELKEKGNPLFVIVSKSGKTLETLVNAALFVDLIRRYRPSDYHEYLVVITDHGSDLWHDAYKNNYSVLEIPKNIGGRYSIFTAVGLFPLGMLGVSVRDLCAGALLAVQEGTQDDSDIALQASIIYAQNQLGKNIYDHFVFGPQLNFLGQWYRQLMGESLGKVIHKQGTELRVGITPTVSLGSIDLHSVTQLYLAGPRDKFTCFILGKGDKAETPLRVPADFEYALPYAGKTLEEIQWALFEGTRAAYERQHVPFVSYIFELNEFNLGHFMQSKMLEMMYLGFLLGVNPFDQPEVELYKRETRRVLSL